MKKFTLIILMLLATFSVKGQVEFAPVGAEWYYERLIMNYETWKYEDVTYDRFRSLGVVEINGWQCKEIELFQNVDCDGNVNPYYETRYINQEGEQIYEVVDGERYLLYDFSKEVGEYWIIEHRPPFELPVLPETDTVFVDEIKEIVLADGSTRRMFVTSVNEDTFLRITNIIEGIGLEMSLFPFYVLLGPPACVNTGIRCYSENDNYLITSDVECDYEEVKPYQSFFGNDSTRINIYDTHIIDALHTFVINISNRDTVNINGTSYYKTTGGDYDYSDLYYREDRETGRLYQYVERNDIYVGELKVEVLICDMSLNVGDTFHFPYELDYYTEYTYDWEPIIGTVTDVRYEDGKKIIEFDEETSWSFDIFSNSLTFTEGEFPIVVPTRGLFEYNELLCQFKDGEQTYHNPYYEECHYDEIISVEEIESKSISIFPTIFSNNELISINTNSEIKEVKMIDMLGREINISINLTEDFTSQISLNQRCNSGIYLIIVETEKDVYYEKVVLRD